MSEPTKPADAEHAIAAPVPWLTDQETTAQTPVQAWRVAAPGEVLFAVSYRYRLADFVRCTFLVYVLRWQYHLTGTVLSGLAVAIALTAMLWRPGPVIVQVIMFLLVSIAVSGILLFIYGMVMLAIIPIAGLVLLPLRRKPARLLVKMHGVQDIPRVKGTTYPWKEIGRIVLRDGDIIIVSKTIMSEGRYVPRTAFASANAANRFHTMLVAAWQASGNPAALAEADIGEFAPTRDDTPSPPRDTISIEAGRVVAGRDG